MNKPAASTSLDLTFAVAPVSTFADLFRLLDDDNHVRQLSAATHPYYARTAGAFVEWLDRRRVTPATLERRHIAAYQAVLARKKTPRGTDPAPRSLNLHARGIRRLIGFGIENGYLASDRNLLPISMPKIPRDLPQTLEPDQVRRLIEAATGADDNRRVPTRERDLALVTLGLSSGLRLAELAALRWEDLRWGDGKTYGRVRVRSGKGGKPRTSVYSADARQALDRWHFQASGCGRFVLKPTDPIFPGRKNTLQKALQRLAASAGVPFHAHTLRHTAARTWLRDGLPLNVVSRLLGHSSLRITSRYLEIDDLETEHTLDAVYG